MTDTLNPRTRMLLEAPIAPTLLRLAAPNVLVMLAQAGVGLIETYFVGKLGTDALAGMALVFPVVMLMQMTSAGAMGGGIASAIARALGARRRDDADALVLLTEWKQFRLPSWTVIRKVMANPLVIDGRNIYDKAELVAEGFTYKAIGK